MEHGAQDHEQHPKKVRVGAQRHKIWALCAAETLMRLKSFQHCNNMPCGALVTAGGSLRQRVRHQRPAHRALPPQGCTHVYSCSICQGAIVPPQSPHYKPQTNRQRRCTIWQRQRWRRGPPTRTRAKAWGAASRCAAMMCRLPTLSTSRRSSTSRVDAAASRRGMQSLQAAASHKWPLQRRLGAPPRGRAGRLASPPRGALCAANAMRSAPLPCGHSRGSSRLSCHDQAGPCRW